MRQIYLDYNASTPIAPPVQAVMAELLDSFGNPSSLHWAGQPAMQHLTRARAQVARLLGAQDHEIVFTSGGSEANNQVIKGVFFARYPKPVHIITCTTEHPSVLATCAFVERLGARITRLPVDGFGRFDPDDLREAITSDTALITLMHANNETGTLHPIEAGAAIARQHGIPFHTDAAQSVGKLATSVRDLGVDFLSIAGQKIYAPKGIGVLYMRAGQQIESLIHGAGHEQGRRAGTESALLAAALGAACEYISDLEPMDRVRSLRDRFERALTSALGNQAVVNGHPVERLANTLSVSFPGRISQDLLTGLEGIAASAGSACHSGVVELSGVLKAMGVSPHTGMGTIRFSLGRLTSDAEIDEAQERIIDLINRS